MQNEIEITEQDLEQLRVLATAPRSHLLFALEDETFASKMSVVLARAGQATSSGRYTLVDGRWLRAEIGMSLTAEQYAHYYFNTPEARKELKYNDWLIEVFGETVDHVTISMDFFGKKCASGYTEPSEAPLDVILFGKSPPDIDGIMKTDFDTYALTVTGDIGSPHTAEQYAHAYFNTQEARRAAELIGEEQKN